MIRRVLEPVLKKLARQYPVVTLTGPRQSGKTTLVQAVFPRHQYASLEDPDVREYALEDPRGFLGQFTGGVVLDEVQRAPDLFSYIQTVVEPRGSPWAVHPERIAELPPPALHQPIPRREERDPPPAPVFAP